MQKQLITVLQLDDKAFKSSLDSNTKGLKTFAASSTAIGAAVAYAAKQTADFQDHTRDVAISIGSTTEEVSKLNVVAKLNGSSSEAMEAALTSLSGPTDKVAKKIEGLGINMKNADGTFKSSTQLMGSIADKMKAMKNPADQAYLATRVFGSGELVQSLQNGAAGFEEVGKKALAMGMIVSTEAAESAAKFNDDLDELSMSAQGLTNTLMTSVIAFANQSGAIQAASAVLQGAIKWWNDLDNGTKDMIVSVGAAVVGVGILTGAIMVGAAAFAAISAPILIAAAALTAIAIVGITVAENWDQMQNIVQPLSESFNLLGRDLSATANKVASTIKPIGDAAKSVMGMSNTSDGAARKISYLGTVVKIVMATIALNVDIAMTAFRILTDVIQSSVGALYDLGKASALLLSGKYEEASALAGKALEDMKKLRERLMNEMGAFAARAKEMFKDPVVIKADSKELKDAAAEAEKLGRTLDGTAHEAAKLTSYQSALEALKKPFLELRDSTKAASLNMGELVFNVGNALNSVATMAQGAMEPVAKIIEESVKRMNMALAKQSYGLDLFSKLRSKQLQKELEDFKAAEDARLEAMKVSEANQLKALQDAEDQRIALMKFYEQERLLAQDREYQTEKEKREAAFEAYKLAERAKFEFDLALLNEKDLTEEERRATKGVMEENWQTYLETLEQDHLDEMSNFQDQYQAGTGQKDAEFKARLQAEEDASAALKEQAARDSANRIAQAQEQSQQRYEQLQQRKEDEEKIHQKAIAYFKWIGEKAALDSTKRIQVAQTMAAGIAGAAQALASPLSIATLGIAGIALGGMIMTAAVAASRNIMAMEVMPPVEVFLASGGVVSGLTHKQGGIKAELENNEAVINAQKTRKIEEFVDAGMDSGGNTYNTIFEKGSITGEKNFDERWMNKLGDLVMDRMRRSGLGALSAA